MLIFLDLDGCITNTVYPGWKPYKDGQQSYPVAQIPYFDGAKDFITSRKSKGELLVIVSDSHPNWVYPIAQHLDIQALSLADKPNVSKLKSFIEQLQYKEQIDEKCFFIGDTKLDIEIGRRIGCSTIWFLPYCITDVIKDERDGIGDLMSSIKLGPTYSAKTFMEIEDILDSNLDNLYAVEASFLGRKSIRAIKFNFHRYMNGNFSAIRCLARQEQGACDKYARADKYYMISNEERTNEFLQELSDGITSYLNQPQLMNYCRWDMFSYLTDKSTTIPKNKMKDIFDLVDTEWAENTNGSLRNQDKYEDRKQFLKKFLSINDTEDLQGKNIIILDDQLTTSATAEYVIKELRNKGANNILFIAIFQMLLPVYSSDVFCPKCGKSMCLKIRRRDGHRFYSCTPPQFKGDGCGYIQDISEVHSIEQKFQEIKQKYQWGFERFMEGRKSLPNFKQIVINSEDKIKLINEMGMYATEATDENIIKMENLKEKWKELIIDNPLRDVYYEEFGYKHYDYYDSEGYLIEYAIENIAALDNYIIQCEKLKK